MRVLLRSQIRKVKINEVSVRRFAIFVMKRTGCSAGSELSVSFVGSNAMRRLNREYRGVDRDTDVLAFPLDEAGEGVAGERVLGDIVISVDRAINQARSWKNTINRELLLYLVHGILHLCGMDDRTSTGRNEMWKRQRDILNAALKKRQWNVIS
jgi:probable rRNA maturation factor